jgi:DNA polymerase-3 subunit gamma/tau
MQAQNFIQLELPVIPQKIDPLKQMEKAIQDMLDLTWNCVLAHITVRATKELMRQQGKLIALNDGEACIKVPSLPISRLAEDKLPDVEAAFKKAFGCTIKVSLVIGKSLS